MTVREQVYQVLLNDTALNELVGGRILPIKNFIPLELMTAEEKEANLPQIVVQLISGIPDDGINRTTTRGRRLLLDVYSLDPDELDDIQEALKNLLDPMDQPNPNLAGTDLDIFWDDSEDLEEDEAVASRETFNVFSGVNG